MKIYARNPETVPDVTQPKASRQASAKDVLQAYKDKIVQKQNIEDEDELLQGKFDTAQREEIDEEELLQGKFEASSTAQREEALPRTENKTGMPDKLKNGIEALSGYSMDDVRVHYNSSKPSQLHALAYAQGTDIHIAPGQEQHLPHEAWHIVQQKQGRVQPTTQLQGINVNDNESLEKEADVMGGKAVQNNVIIQKKEKAEVMPNSIIQLVGDKIAITKNNLEVGVPVPKEVIDLQEEIYNKYIEYKKEKTDKRGQLDQKFKDETQNIDLKQDYLEKAIYMKVYHLHKDKFNSFFEKETYGRLIESRVNKKHEYLVDIDLPDNEKLTLLKKAKEIALELIDPIKEKLKNNQNGENKLKIRELDNTIGLYARSYARHAIADPIVQGYEKGYISSAVNRKEIIKEWKKCAESKEYDLSVITDKSIGDVMIVDKKDEDKKYKIATMYLDNKRFEKIPERNIILNQGKPNEEVREVFIHRESRKEFVQDAQGFFVRRYIKRALNKFDNPESGEGVEIKSDPRISKQTGKAWKDIADEIPSLLEGEPKVTEEIRNHQRAKEAQGGSPFISFTTTIHPIFGSTGSLFESDRGVATVDLARISKERIFDTHISPAMKLIHDIDNPQPEMPFKEGDEKYERNSAARDAMRTREVVIAGDIPLDAIIDIESKIDPYIKGKNAKFQPLPFAIDTLTHPILSLTSNKSDLFAKLIDYYFSEK